MKTFWLFQLCSSIAPIIIAPVGTSPSCTSTFHALANQNVTLRRSPLEVEGSITHLGVRLSCRDFWKVITVTDILLLGGR